MIGYHLEKRGGARLELDVQGQGSGRILDVDGQWVWSLENWTIFMDVICVSSLTVPLKVLLRTCGDVEMFLLVSK